MPNCKNCGTEYEGNFCPHCGAQRIKNCPKCGAEVAEDAAFCKECGALLSDAHKQKEQKPGINIPIEKLLFWLPFVISALFGGLVFAFYATPLAKDPFFGMSIGSGYEILSTVAKEGFNSKLHVPLFITLAFSALCVLGSLSAMMDKEHRVSKKYQYFSVTIFCIVCATVAQIVEIALLEGFKAGAMPILIIVFGFLFAAVCIGALVWQIITDRKNRI